MNTGIHLLCCKNILNEIEQASKSEQLEGMTISSFPAYCDMLKDTKNLPIAPFPHDAGESDNLFIMACKTCPILKTITIPKQRQITFDTVFSLFLDEKLVQQKIAQGGYLLTHGWLMHWKEHSDLSSFTRMDLQNFFKDFCSKIVYIDSSEESDFEPVYDFCKYIDLPYEHVPVKFDFLRLFLKHLYLKWKMTKQNLGLQDTIQELTRQVADYAAMFTIFNELSIYTTEREVIDKTQEILKMLSGATTVKYYSAAAFHMKHPELYKEILQSEFAYIHDGKGFVYAIRFRDEVLGIFELTGFMFNQYVKKYLEFCLRTAGILAVTLSNIRNYKKIIDMSMHDSLTGLKNREFYEKQLMTIAKEKNRGIGIVVCDIDDLKITNDTLGHKAGDQLILRLAEILRSSFRETDVICRIGGDEFAIFVKDCTTEAIEALSNRLEGNLIQDNFLCKNDPKIPVLSFSYGFAIHTEGDFDITAIFKLADERMYQNKRLKKERLPGKPSLNPA